MKDFIAETEHLIPSSSATEIDWEALNASILGKFIPGMKRTPQNPEFHGEGDVLTHTRMVCGELVKNRGFWKISRREQLEVFVAAILHDVGKIRVTCMDEGKWVSPHHSAVGSLMARDFLWRECGLCGTKEKQQIRETVCSLIRHHMLPMYMIEQDAPECRARKVAAEGKLLPDFSWELLCLLSEADICGRIAADIEECLEKTELCRMIAREAGCLQGAYAFPDSYTEHAYLGGKNIMPDQSFYDDTWGEVILMAGLPGTGKDTWIRNHVPELPVISLDDIRREKNVKPTDNQGSVIQEAQGRAREYLRRRQPFVWNATDITREIRRKQISLFERYGASVRIIYLETDWDTQMTRNCGREGEVPEAVIEKMLKKTVPPMPEEAELVEWYGV